VAYIPGGGAVFFAGRDQHFGTASVRQQADCWEGLQRLGFRRQRVIQVKSVNETAAGAALTDGLASLPKPTDKDILFMIDISYSMDEIAGYEQHSMTEVDRGDNQVLTKRLDVAGAELGALTISHSRSCGTTGMISTST
jgi:hypothetical protein